MKSWKWILIILFLAVSGWALTNLVVVVTLSDDQHTNLVAIAAARGQTPQQYLQSTNAGLVAEFDKGNDALRLRQLLQLWETATPQKKLQAIQALQ